MPSHSRKRGRRDAPNPEAAPSPAPVTPPPARASAPPVAPRAAAPKASGRALPSHLPPPAESRSERRNAEIRATLRPYAPGERPAVVLCSAAVAAALALANLGCFIAGVKIDGHRAGAVGILIFTAVLLACAGGLWQMRAGAVLGFMCLMAIIAILFTLFLIEASNWWSAVIAVAIIGSGGYLFFKLVRVLSRLQAPPSPS